MKLEHLGGVGEVGAQAGLLARTALHEAVTIKNRYHFWCVRNGRTIWEEEFDNLVTNVGLEHIIRRVIVGQTLPTLNGASSTTGRSYPDGRRTARVWTTNTTVAVGDIVQPTAPGSAGKLFIAVVAGTTHSSTEPTWPAAGVTVADNTVTWLEASLFYIGLKGAGSPAAGDTMASHGGWTEHLGGTLYTGNRKAFNAASPTSGSTDNSGSVAQFPIIIGSLTSVAGAFLCDMPGNAISSNSIGLLYGVGNFSTARDVISGDVLNATITTSVT